MEHTTRKIENTKSLVSFKWKLKYWKFTNCPYPICNTYIGEVDYLNLNCLHKRNYYNEMFVRMLTVHCDQNNSYEITMNGFQFRKKRNKQRNFRSQL